MKITMNIEKITIIGLMIIILILGGIIYQMKDTYNMAITDYNDIVKESNILRQQCNDQGINPLLLQQNNALGWNQDGLLPD